MRVKLKRVHRLITAQPVPEINMQPLPQRYRVRIIITQMVFGWMPVLRILHQCGIKPI